MRHGRMLILDDDLSVGQTMALVAESTGMEARCVTGPEEFFRALEEWLPTHIVLDLVMPEMDGVEIMRYLAKRDCRAEIIISSGVGSRVLDAARRSAAEHHLAIIGVLAKPFMPATLRGFLRDGVSCGSGNDRVERCPASAFQLRETDLRRALEAGEVSVVYQPKLQCETGALAGFEVLARWHHPEHGLIMPDQFIPLMEDAGLIDALTDQVMRAALAWMRHPALAPELTLSVNLSARSLVDLAVADRLETLCREAGVLPGRVTLELTETVAMEDPVSALDVLTRLRVKGFHLSIDDFGTGYSSMSQLAQLPFSEMKVDKSFVITALTSAESRTIIKSIIDLGHNLGLRVVAEGVEDYETLEFLRRCGCDMAQGFLLSKPLQGERVIEWALAQPDQPWLESPSFFSR